MKIAAALVVLGACALATPSAAQLRPSPVRTIGMCTQADLQGSWLLMGSWLIEQDESCPASIDAIGNVNVPNPACLHRNSIVKSLKGQLKVSSACRVTGTLTRVHRFKHDPSRGFTRECQFSSWLSADRSRVDGAATCNDGKTTVHFVRTPDDFPGLESRKRE